MAAFDSKIHDFDPITGYQIDKATGRQSGLVPAPHVPVAPIGEFPKWVPVHESHVVRKKSEFAPDHVSTPGWEYFHVNRVDGAVSVLVNDEDEEKRAGAEYEEKQPEDDEARAHVTEDIRRQVHEEFEAAKASAAADIAKKAAAEQARLEDEEAIRRATELQDRKAREDEASKAAADEARQRLASGVPGAGLRPVDALFPKPAAKAPVLIDPAAPRPAGWNPPSANEFPGKLKDGPTIDTGSGEENKIAASPSPAAPSLSPADPANNREVQ